MRQKLLDEAWDIVAKRGIEDLTIRSLSEQIHYSTSIVYEHFKSKEEIYQALNIVLGQKILKAMRRVPIAENPDQYLMDLVQTSIDFFIKNRRLIELVALECFGKTYPEKPQEFRDIQAIFGHALKLCNCKHLQTPQEIEHALNVLRCFRVGMMILSHHQSSEEGLKLVSSSLSDGIMTLLRGWRH